MITVCGLCFLSPWRQYVESGVGRVCNRVLLSSSHIIHRHVFYKVFIPLMVFFNGQWKKKWSTSEYKQSLWCLVAQRVPIDRRDTTQWSPNFFFFFHVCRTERKRHVRGCLPFFSFVVRSPRFHLTYPLRNFQQCEIHSLSWRDICLWTQIWSNFLNQLVDP